MTRPVEMWRLKDVRTVTTGFVRKIRIAVVLISDESSETSNVAISSEHESFSVWARGIKF